MEFKLSVIIIIVLTLMLSHVNAQEEGQAETAASNEPTQQAQPAPTASQKPTQQQTTQDSQISETELTAESIESEETGQISAELQQSETLSQEASSNEKLTLQDSTDEESAAAAAAAAAATKEEQEEEEEAEETVAKKVVYVDPKPAKVYAYRQTVFGSRCSFPFQYQGQSYTNCLTAMDGKEYCKIDGALYECKPRNENSQQKKQPSQKPPRPESVEVRFTISGKRCRLPLLVKGEYMTDCMFISSTQEICQAAGKWEICQPKVKPPSPKPETITEKFQTRAVRTTQNGQTCEFPLNFDGKVYEDCVRMPDQREWCQVSGQWQQCVSSIASSQSNMLKSGNVLDTPVDYGYTQEMDKQESQGNKGVGLAVLGALVAVAVIGIVGMTFTLIRMKGQYSRLVEQEQSSKKQVKK